MRSRSLETGTQQMRGLAEFGCTTSDTDVNDLFSWYETAGFLYPQKYRLLKPHIDTILRNWQRALNSSSELMFLVRRRNGNSGGSSVASFRSNLQNWNTQHLVSTNDPFGSIAVMLATCAERALNHTDSSHQFWYRPENRFPNRVFGNMIQHVGSDASSIDEYAYCTLRVHESTDNAQARNLYSVEKISDFAGAEYIRKLRGPVFSLAEGFQEQDITLDRTDQLYREAGLKRQRFVYTVFRNRDSAPVGYCAAYRGPLGLNLSFLENRSDISVDPSLDADEVECIVTACVQQLRACYHDYEATWIPVLLRPSDMKITERCGLARLRTYRQGVWIRDGYARMYEHIQNCFAHAVERRRSLETEP
jgi:hypothetical protein